MTKLEQAVFDAAMSLEPDHRVDLAEKLFSSVSRSGRSQISRAWADEAVRRERSLCEGRSATTPVDGMVARLRAKARP